MSNPPQVVQDYLARHHSLVISGQLPDGQPYAATTCYTHAGGADLFFFVFKNSEKHHLVQGGQPLAVVVDDGFAVPFRGLELKGKARVLEGDEAAAAQTALAAAFPKLANVRGHPAVLVCRFGAQSALWHDWNVKVGHTESWQA